MPKGLFDHGNGQTHTFEEELERPLTVEQKLRAEWDGEERRKENKEVEVERRKSILQKGGNPNLPDWMGPIGPEQE